MTTPEAIFAAAIFLVGVTAWKNWTAIALVASWAVLQLAWLMSEQSSWMLELICDYAVIATIFVKPEYNPCPRYESLRHQMACLITERSPCDRIVLFGFPLMWVLYAASVDPYYRWWGLWWLALAQLLAAGWEGLSSLRLVVRKPDSSSETPPRVMRLGLAGYA